MKVLVVHGPNARSRDGKSVVELDRELEAKARALGLEVRFAQSNSEGALIDRLEQEKSWVDAVAIEPGPLAHAGWALREALGLLGKPAIEIVSPTPAGEPSRAESIFRDVCESQLEGGEAFARALEELARRGVAKTIGPRAGARVDSQAPSRKSIGRRHGPLEAGGEDDEASRRADKARPFGDAEGRGRSALAPHDESTGADRQTSGRSNALHARASRDVPAEVERADDAGRRKSPDRATRAGDLAHHGASGKSIGRRHADDAPVRPEKSIGRKHAEDAAARPEKSIGRAEPRAEPAATGLGRALVQQKIRDRLSGRLGAPELASWARDRWLELQRGAVNPPERERLEPLLQRLALSHVPPARLSDEQLIDLLTELDR